MPQTANAILVDDEANNTIYLQSLIEKYFDQITVIGIANNSLDATELIKTLKPHLVFLDIEMPGISGFELLKNLQPIHFEVLFVTAFNHYALQAFEVNAIGYITKPIAEEKFKQTVEAALKRIQEKNVNQSLMQLIEQSMHQHSELKIALPTLHGLKFVMQHDIIYCESSGNYTQFYMQGNKNILVSRQLGEYEKLLPNEQFIRIHDKYIINQQYIVEYIKGTGGEIQLENGTVLPVSVRKKEDLLQRFEKWIKRK